MRKIISMMMIATIAVFVSCGGDDATSAGGSGGDKPSGNSSVGAWYTQSGSYMLVWDFANNGTVTLHMYEIYGDIYYKTQGTGTYSKKDNALSMTIAGTSATATIVDDVMHMNDAEIGNYQLKKVTTSVQSSINTMETYFDNLQKQVVNEWYSYSDYYNDYDVIKFESSGKGAITTYTSYNTSTHTSFSWTRGGMITITHTDGTKEQYKFNLKEGVLNILLTYEDTEYTITYKSMTDEIRQKIEDLQKTPTLQAGTYVEKNPDVKEYFMVEIDGNDMEEFVVNYGKKRKLIEGKFTITGNQMTIEGADTNGDGVVNDNDKVTIAINGNEVTVGNITFVRLEITADMLVGNWQAYRTVGAEYKSDGTLKESWDWELTGASTGDEGKDNDNARMIFNSDNSFESWTLRNGSWEMVRTGSYSLTDRNVKCQYEKGGNTRVDEWKILSLSATEGVIERLTDSDYVAYYMKKY